MPTRTDFADWLFDMSRAEMLSTFGNRRNWQRFCAIADQLAADLALRRWL